MNPLLPGSRTGFTLVELIVVVAIIGLAMTLGVEGLRRMARRPALDAAVGQTVTLLRAARNSAIARGSAWARVERGRVQVRGWEPVGVWHFEDAAAGEGELQLTGSRGLAAAGREVWGDPEGRYGAGLWFQGARGGELALDELAWYSPRLGLAVEFWARPLGRPGPLALARAESGGAGRWRLESGARGELRAQVTLADGRSLEAASFAGVLRADRWIRLALSWDGRRLSLHADGMEVAFADAPDGPPGAGDLPGGTARILLGGTPPGDPAGPGPDWLADELHVRALAAAQDVAFDGGVALAGEPVELVFGPDGGLDPGLHDGPVSFTLEGPGGDGPRRVRIHVEPAGEVWSQEEGP